LIFYVILQSLHAWLVGVYLEKMFLIKIFYTVEGKGKTSKIYLG